MEYTQKVGRKVFTAEVTPGAPGHWTIRAGAFQATFPMTGPEADAWVDAGCPAEPEELSARVLGLLGKVAAGKPKGARPLKRERYVRDAFVPLDGEEDIRVGQVERLGGDAVSGVVRCFSGRHDDGKALWFVIAKPGSAFDRVPRYCDGALRVEHMTPHEFAEQHRAWHREQFGVSARAQLDRWLDRHADVQFPELSEAERLEIDLAIAIAMSER